MKLFKLRTWGITGRLVLIATVPAFLMFAVVSASLYVSGQDEVEQTIQERGSLIAAALAESSQYGVVSGNTSYLERNVRQLLKADASIASIEVLDALRHRIVFAGLAVPSGTQMFERPIGSEVPDVNLFDENGPHVSSGLNTQTAFRSGPPSGYVQVIMSSAPVFAEKRKRLLVSGFLVLVASLVSGVAGLYLAQRLRSPLNKVMTALRHIRQGEYAIELNTAASGELGELQQAIMKMAEQLNVSRQAQEAEVAERTKELQQAVTKASAADAEKRRLIARTNRLLEEERNASPLKYMTTLMHLSSWSK